MRDDAPRESADGTPNDPAASPRALDRAFSKQLFREMIIMQIDDGPLRRSQRRDLVRFARRMGIDTFEARLIIRAVEYECGVAAPAAFDDRETPAAQQLVVQLDESLQANARLLIRPVAVLVVLMLAWLLFSA